MDKLYLFSVLTESLPEAILCIYLAFLITGEKIHLYLDDRINILRLCIVVPFYVAITETMRVIFDNREVAVMVSILPISLLFVFLYKLSWQKAIINVLIINSLLIVIEAVLMPLMLQATGLSTEMFNINSKYTFIAGKLQHMTQLFLIVSLWNWNKVILILRDYKKIRPHFILLMFILVTSQCIFLSLLIYNFQAIGYISKIIYIFGIYLYSVVYFLFFNYISVISNAVLKTEFHEYTYHRKKANKKSISRIYQHINDGDIEKAKEILMENL